MFTSSSRALTSVGWSRRLFNARVGIFAGMVGSLLTMQSAQASELESSLSARKPEFALGLAAGATTGIGLNARLNFASRWGISVAGMPTNWHRVWGASAGIQLMRTFWSRGRLRSYALLGAHYYGYRIPYARPFRGDSIYSNYQSLAVGPGVGIESRVGRFGFIFEMPLTAVVALTPDTYLRFPGRVNLGLFPNVAICIYLGPKR